MKHPDYRIPLDTWFKYGIADFKTNLLQTPERQTFVTVQNVWDSHLTPGTWIHAHFNDTAILDAGSRLRKHIKHLKRFIFRIKCSTVNFILKTLVVQRFYSLMHGFIHDIRHRNFFTVISMQFQPAKG